MGLACVPSFAEPLHRGPELKDPRCEHHQEAVTNPAEGRSGRVEPGNRLVEQAIMRREKLDLP
jgi:hypothetical protein